MAVGAVESAGISTDACEHEQSALLREYVLSKADEPAGEWSSRGPRSISPFSPCAASRIAHIFAAARLTPEDVLYDLGCGDGRVLHEAVARFGCRCVGVEVDEECLVQCREGSKALGAELDALCRWELADVTELPTDFFNTGRLQREGAEPLPSPTVVLIFITGHGLVALSSWLRQAWQLAAQGVRILTCVESLDTARDYNDGIFAETNLDAWEVYRDPVHARFGVFVVPPYGCSLDDWAAAALVPAPVTRALAEEAGVAVVRGLLSPSDIETIARCVAAIEQEEASGCDAGDPEAALAGVLFADEGVDEGAVCAAAEDAMHGLREHRVLHLHRDGIDTTALAGVRAKLLGAMYRADSEQWGWLRGRSINVRSFEHHSYEPGGSVMDPEHRDDGSILTVSVLLGRSEDCTGGLLRAKVREDWQTLEVSPGDAVIFPSEKRHNVTPLTAGTRQSMVMELWEGGVTRHNRHR